MANENVLNNKDPFKEETTLVGRLLERAEKRIGKNIDDRVDQKLEAGESPKMILDSLSKSVEPQPKKNDLLNDLLISIGSGLAAAGGNKELAPALLKLVQDKQTTNATKQVIGFNPQTGELQVQGTVPKGADVRNLTGGPDTTGLNPEQLVQATGLAREIGGVRGIKTVLPFVLEEMKAGKNIDQISDSIRFSQQSTKFTGPVRGALQQVTAGQSKKKAQRTFDSADDLVEKGDKEGLKSFIKRTIVQDMSADQRNLTTGKERTIEFLDEIKNDLATMEANGIPTNWITGNLENLAGRVGLVKNPEMRKVATKIASAVMKYRRSMTGVQFGMLENEEYKKIFPGINRVSGFNKATLDALTETFQGDVDKTYSLAMGEQNFNELFKDGQQATNKAQQTLKKGSSGSALGINYTVE